MTLPTAHMYLRAVTGAAQDKFHPLIALEAVLTDSSDSTQLFPHLLNSDIQLHHAWICCCSFFFYNKMVANVGKTTDGEDSVMSAVSNVLTL